jgi:hypothetical protein
MEGAIAPCHVTSLSAVFDAPMEHDGQVFCGEARWVRREDDRQALLYPMDRPLPANLTDIALIPTGRADSDYPFGERLVLVRGRIEVMTQCFPANGAEPTHICVPIRRPLFLRGRVESAE